MTYKHFFGILPIILGATSFAQTTTNDLEVKAIVDAGCFLTANDINFGTLQMPLSNQNSSSDMKIKCSNNASYNIQINYGANAQASSRYTFVVTDTNKYLQFVKLYKDGVPISTDSDIACDVSLDNHAYFNTAEAAALFNVSSLHNYVPVNGLCLGTNSSTLFQQNGLNQLSGNSIGFLSGLSSGEKIAFEILNPNNQNWAYNKYSAIANGTEQNIPLKAQIKKENSPTHRLSADTYQSNVTVQLTY